MYSRSGRPSSSRGVSSGTAPRRVLNSRSVDDSYDPRDEFEASRLSELDERIPHESRVMDDRDLINHGDHSLADKENLDANEVHSVPMQEGRATRFDYLDYGAYINRVTGSTIDWRFRQAKDGQSVVNLVLTMLEERQSLNKLLSGARESLEQMKHEGRRQILQSKELRRELNEMQSSRDTYQSKCESMAERRESEKRVSEKKVSQLERKVEELRHSNKVHSVDKRKLEQKCSALKEKVRSLLEGRDRRVMKGLTVAGPLLVAGSSRKSNNVTYSRESLMEECDLLSEDNAHLNDRVASLLSENERLRAVLMRLEERCTDELSELISQFRIESEDYGMSSSDRSSGRVSKERLLHIDRSKFGLPIDLSEPRMIRDIESKIDGVKSAMKQRRERGRRPVTDPSSFRKSGSSAHSGSSSSSSSSSVRYRR